MDSIYAVIANGVVVNTIVWDGITPLGDDEQPFAVRIDFDASNGLVPGIGWRYDNGEFSPPPVPEKTPEQIATENIHTAQSQYDIASKKINALQEQIDDEDWTNTSEDELRAELAGWTAYRRALRSYLSTADGSQSLPEQPVLNHIIKI